MDHWLVTRSSGTVSHDRAAAAQRPAGPVAPADGDGAAGPGSGPAAGSGGSGCRQRILPGPTRRVLPVIEPIATAAALLSVLLI